MIHESLLRNVLRWPMESFDTTPVGRVLNRFSKDVTCVDSTLPIYIRNLVFTLLSVKKNTLKFIFDFFRFFSAQMEYESN